MTFSFWFKRGNLGATQKVFSAGINSSNHAKIDLRADGRLQVFSNTSGVQVLSIVFDPIVFRDTSSWYHFTVIIDTTSSTQTDRVQLYVNGTRHTGISSTGGENIWPSQNDDSQFNTTVEHSIGRQTYNGSGYLDGYLAEVNFIDGTALDASSFGETKEGIWIPKQYSGSYGTNGFYLPFKETTSANGFNTVTYTGNGATQSIEGVGFQPDMIWLKSRNQAYDHVILDSVRGVKKELIPNKTDAERTRTDCLDSFDADGFTMTLGASTSYNNSPQKYVAWCWDAGTGNAVSNSDGSITSTVKANQDYGFSIVNFVSTGSAGTVGHGLGVTPKLIIAKQRPVTSAWAVYDETIGATKRLQLQTTDAATTDSSWNNTAPTSTVFSQSLTGTSGRDIIAYCFADVSGYQKIDSYSGSGSSSNAVTTGFKPAFLLIKRTDAAGYNWLIHDNTRYTSDPNRAYLVADTNGTEQVSGSDLVSFTSTGFELKTSDAYYNASGGTYTYLAIADTRDALFTSDASGNGNNWDANDLQNSDVMPDNPTDGFAVLNNITSGGIGTLTEGNLQYQAASGQWESKISTLGVSSGKWYFEGTPTSGSTPHIFLGLINMSDTYLSQYLGYYGNTWGYYFHNGTKYNNASSSSYGSIVGVGDVVGVALDADAGTLTFYRNGVSQGVAYSGLSLGGSYDQEWFLGVSCYNSEKVAVNFGQDSSFNGIKVAQGNTDDNGKGDFFYAPPSGHLALCNANLPNPAADPNKGENPEDYFNTVLYTGNGSTQDITGVGFDPDMVWHKGRSVAYSHSIVDRIRGDSNVIFPDLDAAEQNPGDQLDLITDGAKVTYRSANLANNQSSATYVIWNWKAGGTGVTNNDGSIQSTVSANTEAGFSIVAYDSNPSGTIGHGLSQAPELIIEKKRDSVTDWLVGTTVIDGSYDYLRLNTGAGKANAAVTAPTSSVFTPNITGDSNIAYCFHGVEGYSKFSSYIGNGSTDGPFVYTGFRPAFVIIKNASATEAWHLIDSERSPHNVANVVLYPSSNVAEANPLTAANTDFLSNGFKLRAGGGNTNDSGLTYIYMAFAEQPFKYSNGR